MGLFGKKAKKTCPICGKEMGFLNSTSIADGEICEDCRKRAESFLAAHQFTASEREAAPDIPELRDNFGKATVDSVRAIFAMMESEDRAAAAKLAEFGDFTASFAVKYSFTIDPKATDVGLKRAKILKGATVADGTVKTGDFQNGDKVFIIGSDKVEATVLECYKQDASDFETELGAHTQKKGVKTGEDGWLILDKPVKQGDTIAK